MLALLQSNYLPWLGYFDIISKVDKFVFYDVSQYSKGSFRNRNTIKTSTGPIWLTVPVITKNRSIQRIKDTQIDGISWQKSHYKTIKIAYSKSKYYQEISDLIFPHIFKNYKFLTDLNLGLIDDICKYLRILTKIEKELDFNLISKDPNEKIVEVCKHYSSQNYLTGPNALNYLKFKEFQDNNIQVFIFDYSSYSTYPQLHGEFAPKLSIIDMLFNLGVETNHYMTGTFKQWECNF